MPSVSHQTIKLSRGRHSSPEHGACVMELASMLAGEGFSDHPRSVSRPIASFLRGYNDLLDDRRREDLYRYAAQAVGTAAAGAVEEARAARLTRLGRPAVGAPRVALAARPTALAPGGQGAVDRSRAGRHLRGPCHREGQRETHAAALALVDELIAMGPRSTPGVRRGRGRAAARLTRQAVARRARGSRRARRAPCARAGARCPGISRAAGRSRPAGSARRRRRRSGA